MTHLCFASKTHFLNRTRRRRKKNEYHVTCFIYLLDIQRLPACFFKAPTPVSFSLLQLICFAFRLLCFISVRIPIQFFSSLFIFCTLHLYEGMCNMITRRTLAAVCFRHVPGVVGGCRARGSDCISRVPLPVSVCTCSVSNS